MVPTLAFAHSNAHCSTETPTRPVSEGSAQFLISSSRSHPPGPLPGASVPGKAGVHEIRESVETHLDTQFVCCGLNSAFHGVSTQGGRPVVQLHGSHQVGGPFQRSLPLWRLGSADV